MIAVLASGLDPARQQRPGDRHEEPRDEPDEPVTPCVGTSGPVVANLDPERSVVDERADLSALGVCVLSGLFVLWPSALHLH